MALVKREKTYSWDVTSSKNTRFKLPEIKDTPTINYEKLAWLCSIEGLKNNENPMTSPEAHEVFMKNYKNIFVKPQKRIGLPVHSEKREELKHSLATLSTKAVGPSQKAETHVASSKGGSAKNRSHNIGDYLTQYHTARTSEDPSVIRANNIKTLRRLLRKLPFERSLFDNDRIFSILKNFPFFAQCVPANVLKELCVIAQIEIWNEVDFTVFGINGLFMVLKGAVCPQSSPYLNYSNMANVDQVSPTSLYRSPTPEGDESAENLEVGECFGTLQKIEGREPTSGLFCVKTVEPVCEFLKISTSDYKKVIEQIEQNEHTEKLNLVLSGEQYARWPRQPIMQVANVIEWIEYPPNTVVASEGYKAPFIGFIKSGECHVLRQLEVMHTLRNGKRVRKTKQVVMGKLGMSDSFAEISVLMDEPISCSIVTATSLQLGIIKPEKIKELDEVTIQLFKQSNTKSCANSTKEDIQEEYLQQELKREWNEFKHNVVIDVINQRGIRPGYGKWSK
ncbi:cyclic nucleotide-binding domain-containing protein 1-like [Gigantopelta aegis]|uniref:cyclic nucleotide-binding domain-containing protein 1-like n=1 Tax=Gigantopelta aegis TaxID=1735272 RepID=UPI001B889EB8|nr:cyclic nucleotide-binding domain-containing protein 1-like [Gigantopelta aegis]